MSVAGIYPFRCRRCRQRGLELIWRKFLGMAVMFCTIFAGAGAGVYAVRLRTTARSQAFSSDVAQHAQDFTSARWVTISSGGVMINNDVVKLSSSGVAARTIVKLVERTPCRFDMSAAEVIRLKDSGVTDEVIYAMLTNVDQCTTAREQMREPPKNRLVQFKAD